MERYRYIDGERNQIKYNFLIIIFNHFIYCKSYSSFFVPIRQYSHCYHLFCTFKVINIFIYMMHCAKLCEKYSI